MGNTTDAKWIGGAGAVPRLRRSFRMDSARVCRLRICGLGYSQVWLNGTRLGDGWLSPCVTAYDRRVGYLVYTVHLPCGENVLAVELAPGWYDSREAPGNWDFKSAPWVDRPKLWCELEGVLVSDLGWKCSQGAYLSCNYRRGSVFDSRLDTPGWTQAGFDDTGWTPVFQLAPPGGLLQREQCPPCRVYRVYEGKECRKGIWDFGTVLAGVVEFTATATPGEHISLHHFEHFDQNGQPTWQGILPGGATEGQIQLEQYIFHSDAPETWHPDYEFHGFRYVQVSGAAKIHSMRALAISSDFPEIGAFTCSQPVLNALHGCFLQSFRGNFIGIPTDCPQREKNGWTADAHLPCEAALMHFDALAGYKHFIQMLVDSQRRSGQLPGIAPTGGWGFNWGNGPVWDIALFEIPWQAWRLHADSEMIERHAEPMARYLDFCLGMTNGYLADFGLGDWCTPGRVQPPTREQSSTLFFLRACRLMEKFQQLRGEDDAYYRELAGNIRRAYLDKYPQPSEYSSILAAEIAFGVRDSGQARRLAEMMRENGHRVNFGVIGGKHVLRVLSENGFHQDALNIVTQPEYPGYAYWLTQGATTLWEDWDGSWSQNHVFYGDVAAWMMEYPAGLTVLEPGFTTFRIRPCTDGLDYAQCRLRVRQGEITCRWRREGSGYRLRLQIPDGTTARLELPGLPAQDLPGG
ncbi:MAG: family 78 glycoside hydrolase catalytic domain, partial [Victivallales bacterium]|nr:family 78 glycoside hydrolase catalytic domain [Victivallales bacterium]